MPGCEEAAAPLRPELLAHCYRMLGGWDEAEDAVQETYLRGWRGWEEFGQRAARGTWRSRIATTVGLNAIRDRGRRALPAQIGPPAGQLGVTPGPLPGEAWVQPFPRDRGGL